MKTSSKIRVAIAGPVMNISGGMEWSLHLIKLLDRTRFELVGVGVEQDSFPVDPAIRATVERYAPVYMGRDGCKELASKCDILIGWCLHKVEEIAHPDNIVVMVCHIGRPATAEKSVHQSDRIDEFVATSRFAIAPIPRHMRDRVTIMPYTFNYNKLQITRSPEEIRAELGILPHQKVLGFTGRLDEECKDPTALADAIRYMPRDWIGVCIGEDMFEDSIIDRSLKLTNRVIFTNFKIDISNYLNIFNKVLIPSRFETCCIAALEAWALGIPVAMTPVGAAADHPLWAQRIPVDADGRTIANIVKNTTFDKIRAGIAQRGVYKHYSNDNFARRWREYLLGIVKKYNV